jgi:hypothetical protein
MVSVLFQLLVPDTLPNAVLPLKPGGRSVQDICYLESKGGLLFLVNILAQYVPQNGSCLRVDEWLLWTVVV